MSGKGPPPARLERLRGALAGYAERGEVSGLGTVGAYGWAGGLGASWQNDPQEDLVGVLMTQRAFASPHPPDIHLDFWTLAHQAIED